MKNNLARVEKRPAEQQALDNLRQFILAGNLKPGERLTEAAIAQQLGVSRATVRTGMHRLAVEGILIQVPYTGWQVASISAKDVWELWTLRGSLEGLAARLVCQSLDPVGKKRIKAAFSALKEAAYAGDIYAINQCDFNCHRTIVGMAGHGRLLDQYIMVENQVSLYIAISNKLLGTNFTDIIHQHAPLAKALLNADTNLAQQEAWNHNQSEGKKLADSL